MTGRIIFFGKLCLICPPHQGYAKPGGCQQDAALNPFEYAYRWLFNPCTCRVCTWLVLACLLGYAAGAAVAEQPGFRLAEPTFEVQPVRPGTDLVQVQPPPPAPGVLVDPVQMPQGPVPSQRLESLPVPPAPFAATPHPT